MEQGKEVKFNFWDKIRIRLFFWLILKMIKTVEEEQVKLGKEIADGINKCLQRE